MKKIFLVKCFLIVTAILSLSSLSNAQYLVPEYIQNVKPDSVTVYSTDLGGGLHTVATKLHRDSISVSKRVIGMIVSWKDTTLRYDGADILDINWLNDVNWSELSNGDGDSTWNEITVLDTAHIGTDGFGGSAIYRSGANDLTFQDINIGTKTLAELAIGDSTWASIKVDEIFAKDSSEVTISNIILGNGTTSKILLDNNVSGKTLDFSPISGLFNTVTLKIGTTGGLTSWKTTGAAWQFYSNFRFDNSGLASIYCNNGSNGLGLNGRNTVGGDIFIESNGRVGIGNGTTAPLGQLHIESDSSVSSFYALFIENLNADALFKISSSGDAFIENIYGFIDDETTGITTNGTGVLDLKANNVSGLDIDDGNDDVTVYKSSFIANDVYADEFSGTGNKTVIGLDTITMFGEDVTDFVDVSDSLDIGTGFIRSSPAIGTLSDDSDNTEAIGVANTYYTLDGMQIVNDTNVTVTDSSMIITRYGYYCISHFASLTMADAGALIHISMFINDVEVTLGGESEIEIPASGDVGHLGTQVTKFLNVGDEVKWKVKAVADTGTITIFHSSYECRYVN